MKANLMDDLIPINSIMKPIKFRELIVILGIPVDNLNLAETLDRLEEFVIAGRANKKGYQVATVNADFVVRAARDPELRTILQEADLATADGMPLVWAARLLGASLKGRVAGSDFVPAFIERAANKDFSVFLLGAKPQVAAKAAQNLQERFPGLKIAGVISPPVSSILEMNSSIIDEIKAAKPDVLLVAFGNPKQEKWISMYGRQLQVPVMIGVGGTLDFIAGNLRRAPEWMQRSGLEWLFRLLQEPRRLWRRYVVDLIVFSFYFARQWMAMRRKAFQKKLIPNIHLVKVNDTAVINVEGFLTIENLPVFQSIAAQAMSTTSFLILNLDKTDFMDSSAIGALISLARQVRDAEGELFLAGVSARIQHAFLLLGLENFFISFDDINKGLLAQPSYRSKAVVPTQLSGAILMRNNKRVNWGVIRTPYRLDASTTPAFSDLVTAQLAINPFLTLDFSKTVYLSSAGLAALLNFNRIALQHHGELLVTHCNKDVLRVIELGGLDRVLTVCPDLLMENA
jgi:N-acetylglucosaminyldiphosphoundecaprenol N-acetyl-beta-D-mannosaminyltransferase